MLPHRGTSKRIRAGLLGVCRILLVLLLAGLLGATLVRIAPGLGTDERELDSRLNHASMQAVRASTAADESLTRYYVDYVARLLHGDLGYAQSLDAPVKQLYAVRLPETLRSVAIGVLLAWVFGLSLAMASVMARRSSFDTASNLIAGVLLCMPAAMLALVFVMEGMSGRLVIGLIVFPKIFQYARNLLQQGASRPYVLHGLAQGLTLSRILTAYVLRPVAPQLLALAGVSISMAFAAAIPVEVICDLPGIGQLAWKAAMARDLTLLVNLTIVITAITLVANSGAGLLANSMRAGEA